MSYSPWFPFPRQRTGASVDLYCLPCAGAAAAIYRTWRDAAPPFVEVVPVELPGRGRRFRETAISDMDSLTAMLIPAVALGDRPIALFGHSMGALIAYELARALGPRVGHLFVSGSSAPHLRIGTTRSEMPDPELKRELSQLGGTPAEILDNDEMMQLLLPMLRADFALVDGYRFAGPGRLSCPVTVFTGTRDAYVSGDAARAWEPYASSRFRLVPIDGGHFYLDTEAAGILEEISRDLEGRP